MSKNELDRAYETVSVEMSNPLPIIRDYTIGAMNKLFSIIRKDSTDKITQIGDRLNATNIQNQFGPSMTTSLSNRETRYTDLMAVTVYVPMVLKPKVQMLDYGKHLEQAVAATLEILSIGGEEVKQNMYSMIGNPAKLRDIIPPTRDMQSPQVQVEKWLAELKKDYGKLASATGTVTERPLKDCYKRSEDYVAVNAICYEMYKSRQKILEALPTFKVRVKEVNQTADKLLQLINNNPDYKMGTVAGQRISQLLYQFAMEIEYVGATCYAIDAYLIAVRDSNIKLRLKK